MVAVSQRHNHLATIGPTKRQSVVICITYTGRGKHRPFRKKRVWVLRQAGFGKRATRTFGPVLASNVRRASRYGAFVSWSAERYRDGTFTF